MKMPPPLTIGIDVRAADLTAGRGRVVRELLAALAARNDDHRYLLYCRRPLPATEFDHRFSSRTVAGPDLSWNLAVAASANRLCDAFLSPSGYLAAWLIGVPTVIVVHDLIPFMSELPAHARARRIERITLRRATRQAGAIVCVSQATRRDLLERYPRVSEKTIVASLGASDLFDARRSRADPERTRERYGLPPSFLLSVGTLEPRKNLERVIEAHFELPEKLRINHPLAVVGPSGWDSDELQRKLAVSDGVRYLGAVDDEDLAALYATCTVFCYPSLYEGFGLPVLEAMKSGAATITSDVASLREVAGDAALYVDPYSVPELRSALATLILDSGRRRELTRRGRERAAAFSWGRTASQILAVIESLTRPDAPGAP